MSEDKPNEELYRRVEEHLQELLEPELPEAKLSPSERLELLEQARESDSCRELLESYRKTVTLVGALPDRPVPGDFAAKVGDGIDASTPVIPFYRKELFQRMLGAAAAVVIVALLLWDAIPYSPEEVDLQLASNDPLPEVVTDLTVQGLSANSPGESPASSRDEPFASADRAGVVSDALEGATPAPVRSSEAADAPAAVELARAAEPEEARELAAAKLSPAPPELESADLAPGAGLADAGGVESDGGAGAALAAAARPPGKSTAAEVEVSRESVEGRLVAVRYEVAVSRSRLAELTAWKKKHSSKPLSAVRASRSAPRELGQRLRARGAVSRKRADTGAARPETMTLLVDPGMIDALRVELGGLQGPAAEAPAEDSAEEKSTAVPVPEASSSRGRRSVSGLPGFWPGAKKKAPASKGRVPEKAAAAKVRVEIRFRVVED